MQHLTLAVASSYAHCVATTSSGTRLTSSIFISLLIASAGNTCISRENKMAFVLIHLLGKYLKL